MQSHVSPTFAIPSPFFFFLLHQGLQEVPLTFQGHGEEINELKDILKMNLVLVNTKEGPHSISLFQFPSFECGRNSDA
jgi:hypothetical protein